MQLIDVTGVRGTRFLVNLNHVRRSKHEDFGTHAHITFVYASGDEDTFRISSGSLAALLETLDEARVA